MKLSEVLTDYKVLQFVGDGSNTAFPIPNLNVLSVTVEGIYYYKGSNYTVDADNKTVNLDQAPDDGTSIDIVVKSNVAVTI